MPAKLNALSCGRDAAPRPLVRAAPDHARRNEIAIGNHGFRGRRQLAEDRMHRGRMRDHVVRAHRLTCGVIEEIGGDLRADRIGIVAVGHGVVVGANERLVGIENGTGHQGSLRKQAGLMPQADTRVPGKPGQSRLSVESSRSAKRCDSHHQRILQCRIGIFWPITSRRATDRLIAGNRRAIKVMPPLRGRNSTCSDCTRISPEPAQLSTLVRKVRCLLRQRTRLASARLGILIIPFAACAKRETINIRCRYSALAPKADIDIMFLPIASERL